jgi:hypothetical protein
LPNDRLRNADSDVVLCCCDTSLQDIIFDVRVEIPANALVDDLQHVPWDGVLDLLLHIVNDLAADEDHNRVIVEDNAQAFAEANQEDIGKDLSEDLAEDEEKDRSDEVEQDFDQDPEQDNDKDADKGFWKDSEKDADKDLEGALRKDVEEDLVKDLERGPAERSGGRGRGR